MKNLFKIITSIIIFLGISYTCFAQKQAFNIDPKEILRIENTLASDDMKGRKTGTPELDSAAQFIEGEFSRAGLKPFSTSFLQEFVIVRPKFLGLKAEIDDKEIDTKNVIVVTSNADLKVNEKSGYKIHYIKPSNATDAAQFSRMARAFVSANENAVVFVDTSFGKSFSRLTGLKRQLFKSDHNVVFVLGNYVPKEFTIKAKHAFDEMKLKNVVGVLHGKTKKNEYVIFSGHYDHIGIGKAENGDSIYNGANDDAAGIAAVIMLANYFKALNNNERTLVFAAFTAEESGGFGSQYFSQQMKPEEIIAMFNIEMIGTESKWGKNSAFITGYDKSDMGPIMQESLKGTAFTFHPDPYPNQQLFYRSDNATLARLGVPAHTISTSKMDAEPNYHKPSDEVKTLDIENMAAIIKAIALSATSIISGKATPARVKVENLK
jgi:Zn-dependent M28 family amino/carboxypeptidase